MPRGRKHVFTTCVLFSYLHGYGLLSLDFSLSALGDARTVKAALEHRQLISSEADDLDKAVVDSLFSLQTEMSKSENFPT